MGERGEADGKMILAKLTKLGIVKPEAKLDEVLTLAARDLLGRRLQSVVVRRGLARTAMQSRQLITHGFIAVGGRKVSVPSFLVSANDEPSVAYYKAFNLEAASVAPKEEPAGKKDEPAQEAAA